MLTCGSLFTGIGGIDLAFVAAGCDILFQVEIDPYCTKVLEKHHDQYWPHATRFTDVREVGGHNLPTVDILFGGFPCQDLSLAGKRLGIVEGSRSGLWFEFARIIGDLRPRVVLLENVPGILTRDGTIVIADLAKMGYVGHWGTLSAADAGAPHQRERWLCVAYASSTRGRHNTRRQKTGEKIITDCRLEYAQQFGSGTRTALQTRDAQTDSQWHGAQGQFRWNHEQSGTDSASQLGNAARDGSQGQRPAGKPLSSASDTTRLSGRTGPHGNRPTESRLGRNPDGVSDWLDRPQWPARPGQAQFDWEPPRVISGQPNRTQRLKALGNAVVPQCIYPIAVSIVEWLEKGCNNEEIAV